MSSSDPSYVETALKKVKNSLSENYLNLTVFILIGGLLLAILIYSIYKIAENVAFYKSQRRKAEERFRPRADNVMSSAGDDEKPITEEQDIKYNDYNTFTDNIKKAVDEFKSYNENLKKFYADNRPGESPQDMIDSSMLDPMKDNY